MTADQMAIETPPPKPQQMTTAELLTALRAHYIKPVPASQRFQGQTDSDLLVEEVCAPGGTRRCDLLRIGMWASRGHRIIVHELKVSRPDFLKELEDPAKAEAWWPYCHEFWIAAPANLIDPAELPDGWGLMVPPSDPRRRRFKVVKQAATKDPQVTPGLLVEIARRVDNARLSEISRLNEEHRSAVYRAVEKERRNREARAMSPEVERAVTVVEQLEKALNVRFGYGRDSKGVLETITPEQLASGLADYLLRHSGLQRAAEKLDQQAERFVAAARGAADRAAEVRKNFTLGGDDDD